MKTSLEMRLEHEDLIKAEATKRSPALDPDWVADHWLTQLGQNSKETAQIVLLMTPEIIRVSRTRGTHA